MTQPEHDRNAYVDLEWFKQHSAIPNPWWILGSNIVSTSVFTARRLDIHVEGFDASLMDPERTIFVSNHTHPMDWLPMRYAIYKRTRHWVCTFIKIRGFDEHPIQRRFLENTGNVPISSRGYLIIMDHLELFGREPDEDEYRALRNHVEAGSELPAGEWAETILGRRRSMCGWGFDPATTTYAKAIIELYTFMMNGTLAKAREAMDAGNICHIYPEGSISSRLCPGRNGALQTALALGLDVVPVGISGMRDAFGKSLVPRQNRRVIIRFGRPWSPDPSRYEGFRPFHHTDEKTWRPTLTEDTADFMEHLNDLLEPAQQWMPSGVSDGKSGNRRFIP